MLTVRLASRGKAAPGAKFDGANRAVRAGL